MDLFAYRYEGDDHAVNFHKVLMTTTPISVEVGKVDGNGFQIFEDGDQNLGTSQSSYSRRFKTLLKCLYDQYI